jgi:dihydrofolate reductase
MEEAFRIEGYAIVSSDGMIADADCVMPNSLKFDADQRFLEASLDNADLLVHGRKSHEGQQNSAARRRLIMTRFVASLERARDVPNAWLWNPSGITLEGACNLLELPGGVIHIIGGTAAYDLFLNRYAEFHLCRAGQVWLPGGTPVLSQMRNGLSPEDVLRMHGLAPGPEKVLDPLHDLTYVRWASIRR